MLQKAILIGILTAPCILAQKPQMIETYHRDFDAETVNHELALEEKSCYYYADYTAWFVSKKPDNYLVDVEGGGQLEFNFCGKVFNKNLQCPGSDGKATFKSNLFMCSNIAGDDDDNGHAVKRKETDDEDDNEKGGLTIIYSGGDKCDTDPSQSFSLEIQLFCTSKSQEVKKAQKDGCNYKVQIYDKEGCYDFDVNPMIRFFSKYYYVFGAFLIVLGFVVGLFGKPLFKPVICLVGTFVFMIILCLFIFSLFFTRSSPNWAGWVVFSISLFLGCIVGLILAKLSRLGVAVLAGWGGFCLGMIIYASFLYKLDGDKQILYWIFNISLGVIAGILSIFLFNHAIVIATAIVGAYAFIRGISFYGGGYPSEFELIQLIKIQGWDGIDKRFYGYMAGFIVGAIICIVLQYKFWMKEKNHNYKHPYHYKR